MRICLNASNTASGTSRGLDACRCHFVTERTVPGWSNTSWTAPKFLPKAARGTWPAINRTGVDREYALVRPDAAFYRPTPGTTRATPGFPDALA